MFYESEESRKERQENYKSFRNGMLIIIAVTVILGISLHYLFLYFFGFIPNWPQLYSVR